MIDDAFKMLCESVKDRLTISLDEFKANLKDFEIIPLLENGIVIGAVLMKENEVHIGYGIKPKASILRHLKQTLHKVIKKYGFAVTSVQKDNIKGLNFCKRLGFVVFGEESDKILLRCERSNYD